MQGWTGPVVLPGLPREMVHLWWVLPGPAPGKVTQSTSAKSRIQGSQDQGHAGTRESSLWVLRGLFSPGAVYRCRAWLKPPVHCHVHVRRHSSSPCSLRGSMKKIASRWMMNEICLHQPTPAQQCWGLLQILNAITVLPAPIQWSASCLIHACLYHWHRALMAIDI